MNKITYELSGEKEKRVSCSATLCQVCMSTINAGDMLCVCVCVCVCVSVCVSVCVATHNVVTLSATHCQRLYLKTLEEKCFKNMLKSIFSLHNDITTARLNQIHHSMQN